MTTSPLPHLAVSGGPPLRTRPWPAWPHIPEAWVQAGAAVLRSGSINYWTGSEGRQFETAYAGHCGRQHAIALANGTLALELALHALGIGPGEEVIVPSRTFLATASCAVTRGAVPVCADVDRDTQNVTASTLDACLSPRTRAVIVVHLAGCPCDMPAILAWAERHHLPVIEDCAQAHGACFDGRPVGSFGALGAFSFCQDKIITTAGEGGMLVLDDDRMWRRAWSYKDHGKDHDLATASHSGTGFRWLHAGFGSNWRLTEVQSALGRLALAQLPAQVERRREHAARLLARLAEQPALRLYHPGPERYHSYYKFYFFVRPERLRAGWDRDRIAQAIQAEGIPCGSGSCSEIYLEAAFPSAWRPAQRWPVARELGETSLMLQVHPTLEPADVEDAAAAVAKVMAAATA